MKRYFNISLSNKKQFNAFISGYSKIFRWVFNRIIRIKFDITSYAPRLLTKIKFANIIKSKLIVSMNTPRVKVKNSLDNIIKVSQILISRLKEKAFFSNTIKNKILIYYARFKQRIFSGNLTTIKLSHTASFVTIVFKKLRDWDYKIPSDPLGSPRYYLSELDSFTLSKMDI